MSYLSPSDDVTKSIASSVINQTAGKKTAYINPAPDVTWAKTGDHQAIHRFLLAVFQSPSRDEFQGSLEEPLYEPTDRLLIKRRNRIVAHVHLRKRMMHFGMLRIAIARLQYLATSPEFRGNGYARQLLAAADAQIAEDRAPIAFLTTKDPAFFEKFGWVTYGQETFSQASPRDIRSSLPAATNVQKSRKLNIRHWRHVELGALMRLYRDNTSRCFGPVYRSDDYWGWMIRRRTYGHIFIAIEGPDKLQLDDENPSIVGYAVTKKNHIMEMMTRRDDPSVAIQLLRRAAGDAIEQNSHSVVFHAPLNHPLHELIVTAGGTSSSSPDSILRYCDKIHMVKIKEPFRFLETICEELYRRAKLANLSSNYQIGLNVDGRHAQLVVTNRSVKVLHEKTRRNLVQCSNKEFTLLMLGKLNVQQAIQQGVLKVSSQAAQEVLKTLFPYQPLWIAPFDQLEG